MANSCDFVSIPRVPISHFVRCVSLAVSLNAAFVPPHDSNSALYIRPLVFGSGAQLNLAAPDEYTFCVFVNPISALHGHKPVDALILESFDRAAPCGTGSAKIGGNYAPVLQWSAKAKAEGYGITLHLDSKTRGEIEEFSTSGFIGLKKVDDRVILVAPDSNNVIKSVTSDSCLELAKTFGWDVEIRSVRLAISPKSDCHRTNHLAR